jgi:ubiquinone/menaquinone biosynthesis C-methylase UbiE
MPFPWPSGFERVPEEPWTHQPLGELALKYDTVQRHGWYDNLEPTIDELAATLKEGAVLVDYSGGTGILTHRLFERIGDRRTGVVIADSSPKFLRLALEKLHDDERVAFRLIRWIESEKRLALLDEILEAPFSAHGVDALASTNAIHLYNDLDDTLASWARVLRTGGRCLVQSGNILNPDAKSDEWIIDATVESIHEAAKDLVVREERWARWRPVVSDAALMKRHDALRRKFFPAVRPLTVYLAAFTTACFRVIRQEARRIEARVADWFDFLAAYHEGVIGWAGGSSRVEGREPGDEEVAERLALMRAAMDCVFGGEPTFPCCWTYVTAETA